MSLSRRDCLRLAAAGAGGLAAVVPRGLLAEDSPAALPGGKRTKDLTIKEVRVTPIALFDPRRPAMTPAPTDGRT